MRGDSTDKPAAPAWLTVKATAELLDRPTRAIYELISAGELARIRLGRESRIPQTSLEDYIERKESEARAEAERRRAARAAESNPGDDT